VTDYQFFFAFSDISQKVFISLLKFSIYMLDPLLIFYIMVGMVIGIVLVHIYQRYGIDDTISHILFLLKEFGEDYSPPEFRIAIQLYNFIDDFLDESESAIKDENELLKVLKGIVSTHRNRKKSEKMIEE